MTTMLDMLESMKHSPLHNYAGVPGLTSWLIGTGTKGNVRLMECSRTHHEAIIPHSHRFDFHCTVLRGTVTNVLWVPSDKGDEYEATGMHYAGAPGKYRRGSTTRSRYEVRQKSYTKGEEYCMRTNEIHSIYFERGSAVLFLEGEATNNMSVILEPVVDGIAVPTFDVKDWMFQRERDVPQTGDE
jgi:hypothetical protein